MYLPPETFTFLVYLQPVFWMLFYMPDKRFVIIDELFQEIFPYAWILFVFLGMPGILQALQVQLYPLPLATFYGLVVLLYYLWIEKLGLSFNKQVSLAFLLAFLLSYWWEWPIHLVGLFEHGPDATVILQATHLLPIIFLAFHVFQANDGARKIILSHLLWTTMVVGLCCSIIYNFRPMLPYAAYMALQYTSRIWAFWTLGHLFLQSRAFRLRRS
ncbi:MAG: hypothetical protein JSW41_04415 [Candidatus Aenigmatarchaeota archaeon]|nr:MAG: hypothetical protein JSW41_04415 [Candidatus Aenigmarchaeota archaeon]